MPESIRSTRARPSVVRLPVPRPLRPLAAALGELVAPALPRVRAGAIVSAVTLFAFFWLLAHDAIQPIAVYLLQLYLVF